MRALGQAPPLFPSPSGRGAGGEVKWQYAIDDVRDQLARLTGPKCLSTTPWTWLRHCPRYFRAIRVRLDALAAAGWPRTASAMKNSFPAGRPISIGSKRRAAVRSRSRVDPVSLDAGGVSRLALCAEIGNVDPRFAETLEQQWSKMGKCELQEPPGGVSAIAD